MPTQLTEDEESRLHGAPHRITVYCVASSVYTSIAITDMLVSQWSRKKATQNTLQNVYNNAEQI